MPHPARGNLMRNVSSNNRKLGQNHEEGAWGGLGVNDAGAEITSSSDEVSTEEFSVRKEFDVC